jgi:hypothetical protein
MELVANSKYRSASPLALGASILLLVAILVNCVIALSAVGQILLLDGASSQSPIPAPTAEAGDARQHVVEIISIGPELLAAIIFLLWVYRASRNAHALCHEKLEFTPGWSLGWFFIPLANLFMPYRAMAEIWRASNRDVHSDYRKSWVSPLLGVWWAAFILSGVIHYSGWQIIRGTFRLSQLERFEYFWLDNMKEFYWGHLIAVLVGIVEQVLTISVIIAITNLQQRKAGSFVSEKAEGQ